MVNSYLEYYGEHSISPVHQDINNIEIHYERRKKLYRQCGIPKIAFKNAEILEVGPGSGYNTLAFFHWDCAHVDLVEANVKGLHDMHTLFANQNIDQKKYEIFACPIEEYKTDKKYDIINAEGFIQHLSNYQQILTKLQSMMADNGIIVITCSDYLSWFIEVMKRLIGQFMVKDIVDYEEKVKVLSKIFETQLGSLRGVSRWPQDWVQDMVLFDSHIFDTRPLSLAQAISEFSQGYDILGTSPQMFTDYSWYKDIWFNYKESYRQQYEEKKLSLLMANMPEMVLPNGEANSLTEDFECIFKMALKYEEKFDNNDIKNILGCMKKMEPKLSRFDDEFKNVFYEIEAALEVLGETGKVDFQKYPHFAHGFGRTQQYIAFVKNSEKKVW